MGGLRTWIRSFFGFSRTETNAFVVLLPLMGILLFSAPAYRYWEDAHYTPDYDPKFLDSVFAAWDQDMSDTLKPARFDFDPNTATLEQLSSLGIDEKIARRIVSFRAQGG